MRCVSPTNGKVAAALVSNAATLLTNLPDHENGFAHGTPEPDLRLEALRRQFMLYGLSLYQLNGGQELALTGPGASGEALPDLRSATLYLRALRKGRA